MHAVRSGADRQVAVRSMLEATIKEPMVAKTKGKRKKRAPNAWFRRRVIDAGFPGVVDPSNLHPVFAAQFFVPGDENDRFWDAAYYLIAGEPWTNQHYHQYAWVNAWIALKAKLRRDGLSHFTVYIDVVLANPSVFHDGYAPSKSFKWKGEE